jgi:hypothetical protein
MLRVLRALLHYKKMALNTVKIKCPAHHSPTVDGP